MMGNKIIVVVTKIGDYKLSLPSSFSISLKYCFYSPYMARNIISFYALWCDGFTFGFDNNNISILVYKDNTLYFKKNPCNGIYEYVIGVS